MSKKIVITIPSVNIPEVEYTFHCLISEFLGLKYETNISSEICDYSITYNSQTLVIANSFFKNDNVSDLYRLKNIPSDITFSEVRVEEHVFPQVSIFGKSSLIENKQGYTWANDVIAATFYMLTRWEEMVVHSSDEHDRFMAKDSLAYNNNFLNRPIVNEYVEVIYQVLLSFGLTQKRRNRQYRTIATHDVDRPYLWESAVGKTKSIAASLFLRRNINEIKLRANNLARGTDPFDTFDQLMDKAESIGEKAHFFFMSGGNSQFDDFYKLDDSAVVKLIKKIKERNHYIGIHPSYNSYRDSQMLFSEIDRLENAVGEKIDSSRQHYLRFDVAITWNNLAKGNLKWDSSMYYADYAGFRSGVCYSYPVYDIINRRQLTLSEKPLIVMDTTLLRYEQLSTKEAILRVRSLQKTVKCYDGDFVFLWHNSSFNSQEWIGYEEVFENMYKQH